mmetsp:Transcript_101697/g.326733  ORF Transcript_101697/g.326733 Transcript_101697/m.326733 type:complete len:251 (-) Transcript_101697:568-1320(-)
MGCGARLDNTNERAQEVVSRAVQNLRLLAVVPYARMRGQATTGAEGHFGNECKMGTSNFSTVMPLRADRLSLPKVVQNFDPVPYLSPVAAEVFENPDKYLVEKDEEKKVVVMPRQYDPDEMAKVFARWDAIDRLWLDDPENVDPRDRTELFPILKDADADRHILDRRRRNARERRVLFHSRLVPHAALLTALPLRKNMVAFGSLEDLESFFMQFKGTVARARGYGHCRSSTSQAALPHAYHALCCTSWVC